MVQLCKVETRHRLRLKLLLQVLSLPIQTLQHSSLLKSLEKGERNMRQREIESPSRSSLDLKNDVPLVILS